MGGGKSEMMGRKGVGIDEDDGFKEMRFERMMESAGQTSHE